MTTRDQRGRRTKVVGARGGFGRRRARRSLLPFDVLVAVLALGLHDCGAAGIPEGWECTGESEGCDQGEVCRSFNGGLPRCYQVCADPWDCPAGEGCSEEDPIDVCLSYSAQCEEHASCWAGFFCNEASGQCVKCGDNGRATDCRGPSAPDGVSAAAGDASVTVTWAEVPGVQGYDLYWSTTTGVDLASQRIAAVTSPYTHTERTNGTTYYYAVVAYDSQGVSPLSAVAFATVDLPAPSWIIAGAGDGQVNVDWAPVSRALGYDLYWGTAADVFASGTVLADVSAPYGHTGLTNGTPYYYGVLAYNAGGNGQPSNVAQATPSATPLAGIGQWCDGDTVECDTDLKCENNVCCYGIGPTCCNATSEAVACGGSLACDVHDASPTFACYESCEPYTSDVCLDGQYCLSGGASCTDKLIDGTDCVNEGECESESCADEVCCNEVCDELCMACSSEKNGGEGGTCTPIPRFIDPDNECPLTVAGCSGAGGCNVASKRDATDPQANDSFGTSVAVSGDYAIIGASSEDGGANDPLSDAGAAYVFHRSGGSWDNGTKLVATDPQAADIFGWSVAISGDYAIVGAYGEDGGDGDPLFNRAGAAYVYRRTDTNDWGDKIKLMVPGAEAGDDFGISVAISGDYAIVGAKGANADAGAAYVFHRTDTNSWDDGPSLVATDPKAYDFFGWSVAISGDYAIVGAPYEGGSGAAYVFYRTGGNTWGAPRRLVPTVVEGVFDFGWSVAISGDYAIVGAAREHAGSVTGVGAAYVFRRTGIGTNTWDDGIKLIATDGQRDDYFGWSVAISSEYAIVGAKQEDGGDSDPTSNAGAAYVFHRTGENTWAGGRKVIALDAKAYDRFGTSVAISGSHAIVGAPRNDSVGGAYLF